MKKFKIGRIPATILVSLFVFFLLIATNPQIGLTWDEPAYIAASESYMGWFQQAFIQPGEALSEKGIYSAWSINSEHPPLDKIWSGVVWSIARNFTDDLTAHRTGNMLLVAILSGLLYLLIRDAYGGIAGFAAVGALLTMPRFFFHAHLSALDIPAAFSVFVVTFAFWKTLNFKHWAWGLLLGLLWGLGLATKINAILIPVTLGFWWLIFLREKRLLNRLIIMGFTAIPVFLAVWPWLYGNTINRLGAYIGFVTINHWQIGQYYLGQFFMPPPWHFSFVMIWAVLPLGLTILYFVGIVRAVTAKTDGRLGWLLFLSALTPVLAISLGKSMVYDNERLMMVAFPFLAGLAGAGFAWIIPGLKTLALKRDKPALAIISIFVLVIIAFAPQLVSMTGLYPHLLSYYGEGVGGLPGATRLGLETTYWCESYKLALPIINAQAKPNDKVWVDPWSHDVLIYYQTQGFLREDLIILAPVDVSSVLGPDSPSARNFPMNSADWYILQHRQTTLGPEGMNNIIVTLLNQKEKIYEYSFAGVPILSLYK